MFITEAIARSDALLNNEYSLDEKLHWCDVVNAELCAVPAKEYKRETLVKCADDTFLLPEDCEFIRIEKLLTGGREIEKQDFRTYGIRKVPERMIFIPKNWTPLDSGGLELTASYPLSQRQAAASSPGGGAVTVIYLPILRPIRHIERKNEYITVNHSKNTITMDYNCPFLPGDVVEITNGSNTYTVNILTRTADEDLIVDESIVVSDWNYILETAAGELNGISSGSYDMSRVITDRTMCSAPYDEMYIDYICAQICFYQRKHDVYQQHIARYNARMDEYMRFVRERAPMEDHTVFRNWWRL